MTETKETGVQVEQYMEYLISISHTVSNLCEDTPHPGGWIEHHLPLHNTKEGVSNPDNWAISYENREMVEQNLAVLSDYARKTIKECCQKDGGYDFGDKCEVLPPWIVFPNYSRRSIGWRMGLGESYKAVWGSYMRYLDSRERDQYREKYPQPEYWKSFDFIN